MFMLYNLRALSMNGFIHYDLWCKSRPPSKFKKCLIVSFLFVAEQIEDDIYATRLCHAAVFWGSPGNDGLSCELEKGQRTKIFNYKAFLDIHKAFSNPLR